MFTIVFILFLVVGYLCIRMCLHVYALYANVAKEIEYEVAPIALAYIRMGPAIGTIFLAIGISNGTKLAALVVYAVLTMLIPWILSVYLLYEYDPESRIPSLIIEILRNDVRTVRLFLRNLSR